MFDLDYLKEQTQNLGEYLACNDMTLEEFLYGKKEQQDKCEPSLENYTNPFGQNNAPKRTLKPRRYDE